MHRSRELAEGRLAPHDGLHELDGGEDAVARGGKLAEDDVARLLAADTAAGGTHVLPHVAVAHLRLGVLDAGLVERLVETQVAHDGRGDLVGHQVALVLHVARADVHNLVAVNQVAVLVDGQAAVGVAIVGKTTVQALGAHELLQGLDMRGTHAGVDIGAVGLAADGVDLRAHGLKHAACDGPRSAVGAVQADALATQGEDALRDEEAHVAIAAGEVILDRAHLGARGPRKLGALEAQAVDLAVEVGLDERDEVVAGLLAVAVHELDAVVGVRVVRSAYHDATVEILGARDIGDAGRRGDVHGVCVATAGRNAAGQGILKHVAGTTRVLAENDACAARLVVTRMQLAGQTLELAVVPAQEAADLKGVLGRKTHARFAAETVGAEILSHKEPVLRNVERSRRLCLR